ncbi:unnamed protein product [Didymodactylos carnosus]|uniref:F-box domain-containing protein n=1 Tax=Didymodactylos carnosus TaxID=1234261 RepID=A0A814GRS1_9BILA|nr:unnamed protein product [Didymodactylos carnosus]CAF3771605.1 unnamed protein product [Didymodactylos carnosus]
MSDQLVVKLEEQNSRRHQLEQLDLEALPNELILQIFGYFNAYDVFKSFYSLNVRLNSLLHATHLHIDLINVTKAVHNYHQQVIISTSNSNQMITAKLQDISDRIKISDSLVAINLQSLTIDDLTLKNIGYVRSILLKLKHLTYLSLTSSPDCISTDLTDKLMETIFTDSEMSRSLKSCKLSLADPIRFRDNVTTNARASAIEYLSFCQWCDIYQLTSLLKRVPKIKSLTVYLCGDFEDTDLALSPLSENLISFQAEIYRVPFDDIQLLLINKLSPKLEYLKLFTMNRLEYMDGKKWEQFLSFYFPILKQFQLSCTVNDVKTPPNLTEIAQSFRTKYYLEHKWYYVFDYDKEELSMYPTLATTDDPQILNHTFQNIKILDLALYDNPTALTKRCYPNVHTLSFSSKLSSSVNVSPALIDDILNTISVANLKTLRFQDGEIYPRMMLELIKFTPNLSTLEIFHKVLLNITDNLTDENICLCLQKSIKNLKLIFDSTLPSTDDLRLLLEKISKNLSILTLVSTVSGQEFTTDFVEQLITENIIDGNVIDYEFVDNNRDLCFYF